MYDNEVKFVATFFSGFWIDTRIYNLHLFLNRQYFVFIPAGRGSTGGAASMENRAGMKRTFAKISQDRNTDSIKDQLRL